ncbi:MAG TPA: PSD1 and planctomycete cytochrome C domain-containing protein [Gemmataceae bacterium]|nr:PSD1 and planctomycete cytochrome C domain-containing protein [Gemmataceae bacterium]
MKRRGCLTLGYLGIALGASLAWDAGAAAAEPPKVRALGFNRDIRPILSDNCYACHGPDKNKRKARLRLDSEQDAFADRGGYAPLRPGSPDKSAVYQRITAQDAKKRMPPAKFGKRLSAQQIDLIRQWIEQGARWQKHWSLIAARRPEVAPVEDTAWPRNPIDAFIRLGQGQHGLKPAPEADRRTLIRRLSFDLTGLPPTAEQVEAFAADRSPDAYEKVVDRLLTSPQYGERMALYWLDLVRYADTGGYHSDNHRDVFLYRDYVIKAFNQNKPFDRFTVEQLAGDLLPNATRDQKIASGYNRMLQTTEEGGAQAKEYLAKYASDRVRNASSVWLGMTLGCAECHDHKFDPFRTAEFYSFQAFFADLKEIAVGRQEQVKVPTDAQEARLRQLDGQMAGLQKLLATQTPDLDRALAGWEAHKRRELAAGHDDWGIVKPDRVESAGGAALATQDDLSVLASGKNPDRDTYTATLRTDRKHITAIRLEALTHPSMANKSLSRGNGNFVLTRFEVEAAPPGGKAQPLKIAAAVADYSQNGFPVASAIDGKGAPGWAVDGYRKQENRTAVFTLAQPIAGGPGTIITVRLRHESQYAQHNIGRFRLALTSADKAGLSTKVGLPGEVAQALTAEPTKRTPGQKDALANYYRGIAPLLEPARKQFADLQRQKDKINRAVPTTLMSIAVPPRVIRVLPRGNWLNESGPVVMPAVPASLPPLGVTGRRATRLDLARWTVAPENPLVARVFVNRLWKLTFGQGIVKTLEDFGSQGAAPTHADLLDWLAVEFRDSGWDVKHMLRLLVTSSAYRQSSHADERLRQLDPYNQWLARQGRFRLDAEMVRDNALAVSGLLTRKVGGPSVKPYQPAGYWTLLNFPKRDYFSDHGADQYRRGLYSYWQRTFLHPSLQAFDAPTREECTVERPRSNTPLQALVLLNDPTYVEAARALAERVLQQRSAGTNQRLRYLYRQALGRQAAPAELKLLAALYQKHLAQYRADPKAAGELLQTGERPVAGDLNRVEVAAWTSVARVVLNLHETVTRD